MPDTISFARGAPSLDILDVDGLKVSAIEAFDSDPGGVTAYGTAVGYPPLRQWIADQHGVAPENVMITNGSMQADALLFDALVQPGDTVITELPTYDRTLLSLRQREADVRLVELESDGIDIAALERVLATGAQPKLAHIIPNFQNPAGCTLSRPKRERLIELAREHGFTIFEDDPYQLIRFSGESQPTMLSMAPDVVVFASSFTKTVCPGVRVGYLIGSAELIAGIVARATSMYISPSMVSEGIVNAFVRAGRMDRSIETIREALRARAETLVAAMTEHLPDARFVTPEGGYFLWVDMPSGTDVDALFDAAAKRGVQIVKGSDFMLEGGDSSFRMAYSAVTPPQIEEGVRRLAEAYAEIGAPTPV
jgi:2-aminoadipate transaminase